MEKLSRLFQGRNKCHETQFQQNYKCGSSGGRTGFAFSGSNVRLVILRDQGPDRRVLQYDSVLEDIKQAADKPVPKKCRNQKNCGLSTEPMSNQQVKQPAQQSSEHKLLGEMMYGGIPMTDHEDKKKCAFKVHTIKSPPQILLTQVFVPSKFLSSRESANSDHDAFDSLSIHSATGETPAQRISGGDLTNPLLALSVPMDVPTPPNKDTENEDSGISGSVQSSFSTPHLSPGDSSSSLNSNSFNSLKRRFKRNRSTSLENLSSRIEDYEYTPVSKRPPKFGMCVCFTLPEDQTEAYTHFELFFFAHITLIEFHMNKLKSAVEQGLGCRNKEKATEALEVFRASVCDLYMAPRLSQPVWLNMMGATTHRVNLCHTFMKEFMALVSKFDTKGTKFLLSNLITSVLCHHLAWVPTVTPAGATPARTYLDKHSAKWLDALAKSHPYNPLWAQLSDVYGAVGFPLRQARTVVTGRKEDVVRRFLYVLTYFLRCSDVVQTEPQRDVAHDSSWLETTSTHRSMTPIIEAFQSRTNSTNDMETFLQDSLDNAGRCPRCMKQVTADPAGNMELSDNPSMFCNSCNMTRSTTSDGTLYGSQCTGKSLQGVLYKASGLCVSSTTLKSSGSGETQHSDETPSSNNAIHPSPCSDCKQLKDMSMLMSEGTEGIISSDEWDSTINDVPESAASLHNTMKAQSTNVKPAEFMDPTIIHSKVTKLFRGPEKLKHLSEDAGPLFDYSVDDSDFDKEQFIEQVPSRFTAGALKHQLTELYVQTFPVLEHSVLVGKEPLTKNTGDIEDGVLTESHCATSSIVNALTDRKTADSYSGDYHPDENNVLSSTLGLSEEEKKKRLEHMKAIKDSISYSRTNSLFDDYFQEDPSLDDLDAAFQSHKPFGPSVISKDGCPFPVSFDSSDSSLNIFDEYFTHESPPLSPECSAQDMVNSTITLMRQLPQTDGEQDTSQTGGHQRRPSGGSQAPTLSRQPSITSVTAPIRCRSITPTELGLRRQHSSMSASQDADNGDESLQEIPMPKSEELEEGKPLLGFECNLGRSLLGGYTDHYMSDFVLHGTSANQFSFMDKLHTDLTMAVQNPVLGEPIAEAVCIVADTDNCTVRLLTSQYNTSDRVTHNELTASHLVAGIVESVHDLWKLKMSPEFCLMHMEDRLQEVYFKSCTLAQYMRTNKKLNHKELSSCLGVDVSDIPLLLAVAGTHTPKLALGLL